MKSCKVIQQKTHYYIYLVYNYVHAHYKTTRKHTAGSCRPVAMAFLKEGRSDCVQISSGRLFQIFGAKN